MKSISTFEAVCNITGEKSAGDRDSSEEFSESADKDNPADQFVL